MTTSRRTFLQKLAAGSALAVSYAEASESVVKKQFDLAADIVVVGLGAAGAATAITAADNGAKVIVVERQPLKTLRSNTRMSGGYIHCPNKNGDMKALLAYFSALFSASYGNLPSVGEEDAVSEKMAQYWTQITPTLVDWLKSLDPDLKMLKTGGGAQYVNFPGAKESIYEGDRTSYQ